MKDIKRQARRFVRKLKGDVSFKAVKKYIEGKGYTVQFIGTTQGDEFLRRFGISEEFSCGKTAFTVSSAAKIIFIDKEKSKSEKLLALLHEVGHIVLGHMDSDTNLSGDTIHLESEAQMFADEVLDSKYGVRRFKVVIALLSAVLVIVSSVTAIVFKRYVELQDEYAEYRQANEDVLTVNSIDVTGSDTQEYEEEYVYITPHGKSYHRAECTYAKNALKALRSEAEQYYTPCSYCKP